MAAKAPLLIVAVAALASCLYADVGDPNDRPVRVLAGERTVPKNGPITQLDEEAYSQDLMEIVAKEAGLNIEFVSEASWHAALKKLEDGSIDVIPTMARLPEREGRFLFSVPHVQGGLVLVVPAHSRTPASLDDVARMHLVLEPGTLQYYYAERHGWLRRTTVATEDYPGASLDQVANGGAEATLMNEFTAIALIHSRHLQDKVSIGMTLPDSVVDFCIAVSPKRTKLLARINEGLFLAQQRGELKQNYEKWFTGVQSPPVLSRIVRKWVLIAVAAAALIVLVAWAWFRLNLGKARRSTEEVARIVEARTRELAEANAALRFSEEKFSKAFMASPDSICVVDLASNKFIEVNEAFAETFGYTRSEVIGKTAKDLSIWTAYSERDRLLDILKRDGRVRNAPYFFRRKDGDIRTGLVSMEAIKIGGADCMAAIMRDVTETERATSALRESEARFRALVESAPEAIIVFDADTWVVTEANENALKMFETRKEALIGEGLDRLSPSEQHPGRPSASEMRELVRKALAGEAIVADWKVCGFGGKRTPVELRLVRLPSAGRNLVRALLTDVTERRLLEEQLRHSQRMESIGQLAGGVAHDFNNILTVIQCNASLLLENSSFPNAFRNEVAQIEQSSSFAASLTRQLLVFSRKQVVQKTNVNVATTVRQTSKLLSRVIGETIALDVDVPEGLPHIHADTGMMEQVLLNLAVNSRDAMPKGGSLAIRARLVVTDEAYRRRVPQARIGRFICLSVRDTGTGIDPQILPRIFDPFFTTKELGKGTGLGLATVYAIVQQHGGWIEIDTEIGKGTEFRVHLACEDGSHGPSAAAAQSVGRTGPKGTILVVEDETLVRVTACNILKREGYRVLEAASPKAAVEIWENERDSIDLVFSDLVMPGGLSGFELVEKLRLDRPDLKVLFTSGYSSELTGSDFLQTPTSFFLQKPFGVTELKAAISRALVPAAEV